MDSPDQNEATQTASQQDGIGSPGSMGHAQESGSGQGRTKLPLLIPEDIRYNCQGCGRCCSGWSVGLTDADYSRVKDIDWGSLHPQLKGRELFIHRQEEFKDGTAQYPHFTKPRADGTCPFLIDNLCFIHGHLSEPEKPGTCQIFPYSFVETPTGVYMGVAFNSMASVRNIGNLLSNQREKLEGYLEKTRHHLQCRARPSEQAASAAAPAAMPFETVALTAGCSVPWSEFLHLDNRLLSIIKEAERGNKPFVETLLVCEELILRAIRLVKEGKSLAELADYQADSAGIQQTSGSSGTHEAIIAMVYYLYLVYPTIRSKYGELWQVQKGGVDARLLAMRAKLISQYMGAGISTILFKTANLPDIGKNNLKKSLQYPVRPLSNEMNAFFSRWLYVKVFAKTYFGPAAANFPLLSGYNSLIACFLCAMLFAKGEAIKRKENELLIADLYEAYWRLDREFLTVYQILPQVSNGMAIAYSIPRVFHALLQSLEKSMSS